MYAYKLEDDPDKKRELIKQLIYIKTKTIEKLSIEINDLEIEYDKLVYKGGD